MAEIDIHGHKVKYDDSSHTLRNAVKVMTEDLDESEVEPWFRDAHHDHKNHTSHFEIRDHERNRDSNLTLVYEGNDTYHLRKRSTSIFK